jgi:hypothetical protein
MTIVALRCWRKATHPTGTRTRVTIALGLALATCWLVQVSYFGLRPWYLVWTFVPGASAVRMTFRFQIVLNLVAALLVALALDRIRYKWFALKPRTAKATAAVAATLLIVEQISRAPPIFRGRSRSRGYKACRHRLRNVAPSISRPAPAPPQCSGGHFNPMQC